ncbi:hypothetical protein GW17_00029213 [Ensete ventricosum]|nr:hypothetical protein GW17_00029213 [Ensete ventricosum]
MKLLQLVVNRLSDDLLNDENLRGMSAMPLHEALRSISTDIWSSEIRIGISEILQNRVVFLHIKLHKCLKNRVAFRNIAVYFFHPRFIIPAYRVYLGTVWYPVLTGRRNRLRATDRTGDSLPAVDRLREGTREEQRAERSVYRSAGRPVGIAWYGALPLSKAILGFILYGSNHHYSYCDWADRFPFVRNAVEN